MKKNQNRICIIDILVTRTADLQETEEKIKRQVAISKTSISISPAKQFRPLVPCVEPNQEIQIGFGGPICIEKGNEVYFLAAIDRFSKYPTACFYEKGN